MRFRISASIRLLGAAGAPMLILLLANCRGGAAGDTLEDRLEKLPTLPAEIAATLDPKTNATRLPLSPPAPVKNTAPPPAPCCGSKDQKSLKVRVSLTKCAPLLDFIMAPVGDLVMARTTGGGGAPGGPAGAVGAGGNVRAYKLNTVNRVRALDTIVCMTSDGPWDATFIEDRNCNNYQPQDSLIVSGWGGLVAYYWNGGVSNHPPQIQLVSCRDLGLFRYGCGGLSGCNCESSPCPADQPCPCNLPW